MYIRFLSKFFFDFPFLSYSNIVCRWPYDISPGYLKFWFQFEICYCCSFNIVIVFFVFLQLVAWVCSIYFSLSEAYQRQPVSHKNWKRKDVCHFRKKGIWNFTFFKKRMIFHTTPFFWLVIVTAILSLLLPIMMTMMMKFILASNMDDDVF